MSEINSGRRSFLIGSGSSLLLTMLPFPAFAETPNAVCSKAGQKILFKGKNYICKKSGAKLHWELLAPARPPITTHPSPESSAGTTPSKVSGFIVAKISDLPEGVSKVVVAKDLKGKSISLALFLSGGVVTAHSIVCTHQGCFVAEAGKTLACPCHGSVFNGATGAVINGPAQTPLQSYKVAEANGEIYIQSDI
jgi:nitrite reductase/ring-hydroxylating ferredoxin subunit